uniref:Uncharacterized protein n=1 Tax=Rhizophagus irregularis (strain DAOM 181602 / DAOM 197198 / MUCL 43194) TaxID=747089 RepID=U9URT1_RHIID
MTSLQHKYFHIYQKQVSLIVSEIYHSTVTDRLIYITCASFNNITIPNEVHVFDIMPMPPDKCMRRIFKYWFVVKDVASRYRRSLKAFVMIQIFRSRGLSY